jgi:hypothetical protein
MFKGSGKNSFWIAIASLMLIFTLVFTTGFFPATAQAQGSEPLNLTYAIGSDKVQIKPMAGHADIYEFLINQQVVMRYRTMSQGLSAQERATIIFQRAQNLGSILKEGTVVVDQLEGSFVVKVGDKLFITVTEADFRANNSTGKGLANVWAENLLKARTFPVPSETARNSKSNKQTQSNKSGYDAEGIWDSIWLCR